MSPQERARRIMKECVQEAILWERPPLQEVIDSRRLGERIADLMIARMRGEGISFVETP